MSISLASLSDINEIMSFINLEWKEGHILAKNQDFFKYEHKSKDQINFVISKDENMKINGVLGFIPSALEEDSDICTVIWKVSKNNQNPILGIQLLQFLQKKKGVRIILSVGINKKTIGIYKYLGIYTDSLNQFVMINKNIQDFKIAKVNKLKDFDDISVSFDLNYKIKLVKREFDLSDFNFEEYRQNIPFKNKKYFYKRYFEHPIYQYSVYGAYFNDKLSGLIVTRVQSYNESKVLRIVDFIGEENCLLSFGNFFSELIVKKGYEYADFYCFGLHQDLLNNAGFYLIDPSEEDLIIPNYFSPYLLKNIPIYFFADTNKIESLRLFKADGDQDRPN
ncbi:hypothetical protein [Flavobacterium geliluteum]|uniref:Uncharacterized protein n=1 Tax=Flavobacterium geliluteum TaxID=2816120 RepID=A0A940X827_9FLAO|nr:hypothetical protein [Flavobacterium geliluteum]MBP4137791.1 hypothetical protein [Flavobacterium geliluteum]